MHKPSRSRPAGSEHCCFSRRRPTLGPGSIVGARPSPRSVRGAIVGIASCPPLLCHESSRCRWLLLSQDDAVVRDRHRGPGALPRPRPNARPRPDDRSALKLQPAATGPRVANEQSQVR
jgi:hypothetical protein